MPLTFITADGPRARPDHGDADLRAHLASQMVDLPDQAPVMILVHGYKYTPTEATHSPHQTLQALDSISPQRRAMSWPRHLGFGRGQGHEGLCVSFGWHARGWLWDVYARAAQAGRALAELITTLRAQTGRDIHILCHSMGARVVLGACARLEAGALGRVVMLSAADYQSSALEALTTPAGATAEFINVTSRENDTFDFLLECLVRPNRRGDRALGGGLREAGGNWLDIQLDDMATLAALNRLGFRIGAPERLICHWSTYMRPGVFGLYGALLREADALPLEVFHRALPPVPMPRWSRLRKAALRSRGLQGVHDVPV